VKLKIVSGLLTADQVLPGNYFGKRVGIADEFPFSEDYEWLMSAGKRDVGECSHYLNSMSKVCAIHSSFAQLIEFVSDTEVDSI
jgi:hypothetical protein